MPRNLNPAFDAIEHYENWLQFGPYNWNSLRAAIDKLQTSNTQLSLSSEISPVLHKFDPHQLDTLLVNCRQPPYDAYFENPLTPDVADFSPEQQRVLLRHFTAFDLMAWLSQRVQPLSTSQQNFIKLRVIAKQQRFIVSNAAVDLHMEMPEKLLKEDPARSVLIQRVNAFLQDGPYTLDEFLKLLLDSQRSMRPFYMTPVLDACLHKFPIDQMSLVLRTLRLDDENDMPLPKFNEMSDEQIRAFGECVAPNCIQDYLTIKLANYQTASISRFLLEAITEADQLLQIKPE